MTNFTEEKVDDDYVRQAILEQYKDYISDEMDFKLRCARILGLDYAGSTTEDIAEAIESYGNNLEGNDVETVRALADELKLLSSRKYEIDGAARQIDLDLEHYGSAYAFKRVSSQLISRLLDLQNRYERLRGGKDDGMVLYGVTADLQEILTELNDL